MAIKPLNEKLFFLRAVPTPTDAAKNNFSFHCIVFILSYEFVRQLLITQEEVEAGQVAPFEFE